MAEDTEKTSAAADSFYGFENFGEKIKQLRLQKELTQQEVANALHVTPGYVSNVENNRTAMSLRMLISFARLMDMTLDELVGDVTPQYRDTAVSHQLAGEIAKLSPEQQEKLVRTLRIWNRD